MLTILRTTMGKVRRTSKRATFRHLGRNLFAIIFETETDKQRVMDGRLCLFDNNLFVLNQLDGLLQPEAHSFETESFWLRFYRLPVLCMNRKYGHLIGCSVGEVEEVEVDEDDTG